MNSTKEIKSKWPTRVELENYLTALDELENQRAVGLLNRSQYRRERDVLNIGLFQRDPGAWRAVNAALAHLLPLPIFDRNMNLRLSTLERTDYERFKAWRRSFVQTNLGPVARRILEAHEVVEVPPIPEPATDVESSS